MLLSYFWIAAPHGCRRSWSSDASDDEELLQMMDNLEECLTSDVTCMLHFVNFLSLWKHRVALFSVQCKAWHCADYEIAVYMFLWYSEITKQGAEDILAPHICSISFALGFYMICTLFRQLIVGKFWRSNSTSSLCRKLSLHMWVGEIFSSFFCAFSLVCARSHISLLIFVKF